MHDTDRNPLPPAIARELAQIDWLEPWWCFCLEQPDLCSAFESELRKELCDTHVLHPHGRGAAAIAKREDRDDFLFWLPRDNPSWAIVHLTFKGTRETDPRWPRCSWLQSLTEFVEKEMNPANQEWQGI